MRTAVVGVGVIGNVHIRVLLEQKKNVVALCDTDAEKLKAYPDIQGYADYLTMLDEVKPNVVHICTPHHLHADMTIAALDRGINVLCEKPLCIKEEDIPRILAAEERSSAKLGVCFQNRYAPANDYIKKYLQTQEIQSVWATLAWKRDAAYYASASWRGKKATEGGGVLINQAIHTLDLIEWLTDTPEFITARTENFSLQGVIDVEDTAIVRGEGVTPFTLFATNAHFTDCPVEIKIKTEDDLICIKSNTVEIGGKKHNFTHEKEYYGKPCYGVGHSPLIYDFYDCLATGRAFPIDGKEGMKAVRTVLTAYKSNGEKIQII